MQRNVTKQQPQQKPIKVVNLSNANIKQTVPDLVKGLTCCQNCQLVQLLFIFAQKIDKLRIQRNKLKQKYIEDTYALQKQVSILKQQNNALKQTIKKSKKYNQQHSQFESSEDSNRKLIQVLQQQIGVCLSPSPSPFPFSQSQSQIQQTNLLQQIQQCQQQNTQKIDNNYIQNINKIALRYNISQQQLENMLSQYLQREESFKENNRQQYRLRQLQRKLEREREKDHIRKQLQFDIKATGKYAVQGGGSVGGSGGGSSGCKRIK